jgi:signal transduction histidine kinase/DNA-binding NarL/FixJ family response regulator
MRFRTKLFLAWAVLVMLVFAGSIWPVHNTISTSFGKVASNAFSGTKQSLHGMQAEQVARMRQACRLLMDIPELRALIAETGVELSAEYAASLHERIDSLSRVVSVQSIFILDDRAQVIAQSTGSPWKTLAGPQQYFQDSRQARALLTSVFTPPTSAGASAGPVQAQDGIWSFGDKLYQVVGAPLTFQSAGGGRSDVEGALVMLAPITDELALELARRHNCAVSFVVGSEIIASSLSAAERGELSAALSDRKNVSGADFDMNLGNVPFRSSYEPLIDASSQTTVGETLVQSSLAEAASVQSVLWRDLAAIGLLGLSLAAVASFLFSAAVTRPVQSLLEGVRHVASGDLAVSITTSAGSGGGEFRELAGAFNDMVKQLRARAELERQVEASRAASQAKSQFLANMSHEIRTPLNGVLGMIDLLQETPLDDKQKRFSGLIKTSANILSTVINDLLDFSKIEAGKIELEAVDFDLRLAVYEVVELLEPKAAAKGLALTGSFADEFAPIVRGDPKRLQQILINLVNNALKFTETGGVTIKLANAPTPGLIRFEVNDTGIGIPADRMHRLFQSFSQVDASTTRKYGGTGLGLAICKQLAELMGGAIGVTSDAGKGSTFWFTAKLEASAPGAADALCHPGGTVTSRQADIARRSRFRILLAEDNEINQIVATEVLSSAGYACEVASDGRQALAMAVTGKYDLVLMDCQMPVMDGLSAARAIRRHEAEGGSKRPDGRRLPIIALTANALGDDREQSRAAGMDGHCLKPLDRVDLIRTMDSLLFSGAPSGPASDAAALAPAETPPAPLPVLRADTPPIRLTALLARCMGKSTLAADVLRKFERQSAESIDRLRAHLLAADAAQFARVSHTLKGTASLMSADAITRIASELERAGNSRDFTCMEGQLRRLAEEVERCREFIAESAAAPQLQAGA